MLRGGARFLHVSTACPQLFHVLSDPMFGRKDLVKRLDLGDQERNRLLESLEKYVEGLAECKRAQAAIESKFRMLEMEWENSFEKLKSISGRIAKRQALDAPELPELPPAGGNGETEPDPYPGADPITRRILMRRNPKGPL